MQLPSKKIVPIFLACAIAGGGIAYASEYKVAAEPDPRLIVVSTSTEPASLPTNTNWQQTLSTVAPGSASSTAATSSDDDDAASSTITDSISKELLSAYLSQTQDGGQATPDFESTLVNKLVSDSNSASLASTAQVYTSSDLKISNDNSVAGIRAYGNALGKLIENNGAGTTTTELVIYSQAAENNDPQFVSAIAPIIEAYQNTLTGLLSMSVPSSAASVHLAMVNSYSQVIAVDEALMKLPTDPAASIYGIQEYQVASTDVYNSFQAYPVFFKSAGATFAPSEPGYILSSLGN